MDDVTEDLWVMNPPGLRLSPVSLDSWVRIPCGTCGESGGMMVIARTNPSYVNSVEWLRCVHCRAGSVVNEGVASPGSRPLSVPQGLPPADAAAWDEVLACLSVNANTAAIMMCRKLLFHVAVSKKMPAKLENGKAPSFVATVDYLEEVGIITKRMRSWADGIKNKGNEANHDLGSYSAQEAIEVAKFTHRLLQLAYETDFDLPEQA